MTYQIEEGLVNSGEGAWGSKIF